MMKLLKLFMALSFVALLLAAGFGYGRWYSTREAANPATRKPLYYVDAMHPWYKSDKPGIAPDCGMKLVPVYPDGTQGTADNTTQTDTGHPQLLGVRYEEAVWSNPVDTLHAVGRVAIDET